jgi:hypothetical protein
MVFMAGQWFSWQVSGFNGRSVVFIAGQWFSWQFSGFHGRSVVFMAGQWLSSGSPVTCTNHLTAMI